MSVIPCGMSTLSNIVAACDLNNAFIHVNTTGVRAMFVSINQYRTGTISRCTLILMDLLGRRPEHLWTSPESSEDGSSKY